MKLIVFFGALLALFAYRIECVDLNDLFSRMTYEDKCGQMTQVESFMIMNPIAERPTEFTDDLVNTTKLLVALSEKKVGSLLIFPYSAMDGASVAKFVSLLHTFAKNSTRLQIPVLYGCDFIHGVALLDEGVVFPQQLALASSFNTQASHRIGEITAKESRALGVPWNFSPILDIGRQPVWPRFWETYGEDVHMATKMAEAYISGHQGDDLTNRTKAAVCLKHYMGYSYPINGLDRTNAYIPDVQMREKFLPTFAGGVATGALTVMVNSANVNGIPGHANSYYLNDILKGELKFKGFTVSDWQDIIRLHTRDKVAATPEEAVRIAVMAGMDMSMVPTDYSFYDHCVNLTKKDFAFAKRVDDAAMRILRVKQTLGLFDDPFPHPEDLVNIATQDSIDFNLDVARETIILAKNTNNFLPITTNQRILVTGPTANLVGSLVGAWTYTWQGNEEDILQRYGRKKYTVYESIQMMVPNAIYRQGANLTDVTDLDDAVSQAQNVDIIVLCIGETGYAETPGNIKNLALNQAQVTLAQALSAVGKPIVVVYLGGRPRLINDINAMATSLLMAFYPGERGGEAIADVIFGRANPSARLPFTYPSTPNGITTYDYVPVEQGTYQYLYRFGHGLSFTTFSYSNLVLSTNALIVPNELTVSVTVTNTGARAGKEIVLVYINDAYASVPQPVSKLSKFAKIDLNPGESKTLSFCLNLDDLSFINNESRRVYEAGRFNVYVSNLSASFDLIL